MGRHGHWALPQNSSSPLPPLQLNCGQQWLLYVSSHHAAQPLNVQGGLVLPGFVHYSHSRQGVVLLLLATTYTALPVLGSR